MTLAEAAGALKALGVAAAGDGTDALELGQFADDASGKTLSLCVTPSLASHAQLPTTTRACG